MHKNLFEKDTNARWMAVALLVLAPLFAHGQQTTEDAAAIRALAADARTTLTDRIEPPVSSLPFTCIAQRTETAPIREYILRQQAEALEALVASATKELKTLVIKNRSTMTYHLKNQNINKTTKEKISKF
jgi:hypothetical protein